MGAAEEDVLQRYDENGCRLVVGCIPYKRTKDNQVKILMIRSQSGKNLVFPKGGWEHNETSEQAAAREAREEAGVEGEVGVTLGKWKFHKSKRCWDVNPMGACLIEIFPLEVNEELESWPEQHRERKWINVQRFLYHDNTLLPRIDWIRESLNEFIKLNFPRDLLQKTTCTAASIDPRRSEKEDDVDTRVCRHHAVASTKASLCCSVTALVP